MFVPTVKSNRRIKRKRDEESEAVKKESEGKNTKIYFAQPLTSFPVSEEHVEETNEEEETENSESSKNGMVYRCHLFNLQIFNVIIETSERERTLGDALRDTRSGKPTKKFEKRKVRSLAIFSLECIIMFM